jgi:hypothetical protein
VRRFAVAFALVAVGCAAPRPPQAPSPETPAPQTEAPQPQLSKQQVVRGMRTITGNVADCYDRYREIGTHMARVRIEPDGKVSDVRWLDGLPSGTTDCIGAAIRTVRFEQFTGPAMTVQYPVILH